MSAPCKERTVLSGENRSKSAYPALPGTLAFTDRRLDEDEDDNVDGSADGEDDDDDGDGKAEEQWSAPDICCESLLLALLCGS